MSGCGSHVKGITDRPVFEMIGITKRFPGALALDSVDFQLKCGEIHAIAGENGAGKSARIISHKAACGC